MKIILEIPIEKLDCDVYVEFKEPKSAKELLESKMIRFNEANIFITDVYDEDTPFDNLNLYDHMLKVINNKEFELVKKSQEVTNEC